MSNLHAPCPHLSHTGIDQSDGPDKIWRCDHCGEYSRDEPDPDKPGLHRRIPVDMGAELATAHQRIAEYRNAACELCAVAELRGDCELPAPPDDPLLWSARMAEAWRDLRDCIRKDATDEEECETLVRQGRKMESVPVSPRREVRR